MPLNIFKKEKKPEKNVPVVGVMEEKKEVKLKGKAHGSSIYGILKQPHTTEKATRIASENKYVFLVDSKATKPAVKKEVARRYGVRVVRVNMTRKMKRPRRWGYRTQRPPLIKKAIITLAEGQKLEIA